MQFDNGMNTEG